MTDKKIGKKDKEKKGSFDHEAFRHHLVNLHKPDINKKHIETASKELEKKFHSNFNSLSNGRTMKDKTVKENTTLGVVLDLVEKNTTGISSRATSRSTTMERSKSKQYLQRKKMGIQFINSPAGLARRVNRVQGFTVGPHNEEIEHVEEGIGKIIGGAALAASLATTSAGLNNLSKNIAGPKVNHEYHQNTKTGKYEITPKNAQGHTVHIADSEKEAKDWIVNKATKKEEVEMFEGFEHYTDSERTAHAEGKYGYRDAQELSDNPYHPTQHKGHYKAWKAGWQEMANVPHDSPMADITHGTRMFRKQKYAKSGREYPLEKVPVSESAIVRPQKHSDGKFRLVKKLPKQDNTGKITVCDDESYDVTEEKLINNLYLKLSEQNKIIFEEMLQTDEGFEKLLQFVNRQG